MKPVLLLIHPKYGVVERCEINGNNTENVIKETWRKLRGKKYLECTIEVENMKPRVYKRIIYDIKTFEVYYTITDAAKASGLRWDTVKYHLVSKGFQKRKRRFKYLS